MYLSIRSCIHRTTVSIFFFFSSRPKSEMKSEREKYAHHRRTYYNALRMDFFFFLVFHSRPVSRRGVGKLSAAPPGFFPISFFSFPKTTKFDIDCFWPLPRYRNILQTDIFSVYFRYGLRRRRCAGRRNNPRLFCLGPDMLELHKRTVPRALTRTKQNK